MRVALWNIRQGGGKRLPAVRDAVLGHRPDVIVLTEFRLPLGQPLLDAFADMRWTSFVGEPVEGHNRIAVLSRLRLEPRLGAFTVPPFCDRWLEFRVPDHRFTLAAIYGPMKAPKPAFWAGLLKSCRERQAEHVLLLGDLNTGDNHRDRDGTKFDCSGEFVELGQMWTDVWRHFHGDKREFSWYRARRKLGGFNGFRLDHAFASPALAPRIQACSYSHAAREAGLSDHSLLIVDLA